MKIDYGFKVFDDKRNGLDLDLLEIYKIPKWLSYLIFGCFVIGILVVPLPYKFLILILLVYIFGILF